MSLTPPYRLAGVEVSPIVYLNFVMSGLWFTQVVHQKGGAIVLLVSGFLHIDHVGYSPTCLRF